MRLDTPPRSILFWSVIGFFALSVAGTILFQPETRILSQVELDAVIAKSHRTCREQLRSDIKAASGGVSNVLLARLLRKNCGPVYLNGFSTSGQGVSVEIPRDMLPFGPVPQNEIAAKP